MLQHQVLLTVSKLVWIETCYLSYPQWLKSLRDGGGGGGGVCVLYMVSCDNIDNTLIS